MALLTRRLRRHLAGAALPLLLLFAPPLASAQETLPAGVALQRSLGGISEYRLGNGLQLLLMPVPSHAQTQVTVIYRVGARHEGPGEAGMAHLLEHVTFRGSLDTGDLGDALRQAGARFNGTTTLDRTNYLNSFAPSPATLREVLRLEAARMSQARLAEPDFLKEKPLVLNEMGLRIHALPLQMHQAMAAGMFRQHPYGRPVIGYTAEIEQLSLATLRRFYERHYRPDNAVLLISGSFEPAAALAEVAAQFGALASPAAAESATEPAEPAQPTPRVVTTQTRSSALAVGWRVPGAAHPDTPALLLLQQWLAGASAAHAQSLGKPHQGLLLGGANSPSRDPFLLGLMLHLPEHPSADAEQRSALQGLESAWLSRLYSAAQQRPDRAGLNTLARTISQALQRQMQDPQQAPYLISQAVGAGDWRLPYRLIEALPQLSADDLRRVASAYLREENRVLVRGVTDSTVGVEPQMEEQALGLFARLFSSAADVQDVKDPSQGLDGVKPGAPSAASAPAFDSTPEALERQVRRYQLPSGLKVAVLPKPSSDDRVLLTLQLRWGKAADMSRQHAWRALNLALLGEGAGSFSAAEIRRLRQQLQVDQLQLISGPQQLSLLLSTRRASLVPALALLGDLLQRPELPDAAFQRVRAAALAQLAGTARQPGTTAAEQHRRHVNKQLGLQPGDPAYQLSAEEIAQAWRALDIERLRQFRQQHWTAKDARVAVVGAIPGEAATATTAEGGGRPETLLAALERWIGDWQPTQAPAYEPLVMTHRPLDGARFSTGGDARGSALITLHQELPLQRGSTDAAALLVGSRLLAGAGIGSRLGERLRQQEALSYAVSAQLLVPRLGNRARLSLQASGAPANAARVEALIKEEIARLLGEGLTAAELEQTRRQLLDERRQLRGNEAVLAAQLMDQLDSGSSFIDEQAREDTLLQSLSVEQVQEALRRLLDPQRWVIVVTGAAAGG